MSNNHPLPPKKEVALALLERSSAKGIFVHLDPRQAAVVVPPWFKKQPQLVLQIGLNMPIAHPLDLRLDDDGMPRLHAGASTVRRSSASCRGRASSRGSAKTRAAWSGPTVMYRPRVPLARQGQGPGPAPVRAVEGGAGSKKAAAAEKAPKAAAAKARRPRKRALSRPCPTSRPRRRAAREEGAKPPKESAATPPRAAHAKRPAAAGAGATAGKKKRELPLVPARRQVASDAAMA